MPVLRRETRVPLRFVAKTPTQIASAVWLRCNGFRRRRSFGHHGGILDQRKRRRSSLQGLVGENADVGSAILHHTGNADEIATLCGHQLGLDHRISRLDETVVARIDLDVEPEVIALVTIRDVVVDGAENVA